jgi:hypothetical protein
MNNWLNAYKGKKTFDIGDIVFWDRMILTKIQVNELIQEYGYSYFEVLSFPYDAMCQGMTYGEWVRLGRNDIYVTRTNPRNLIKITL